MRQLRIQSFNNFHFLNFKTTSSHILKHEMDKYEKIIIILIVKIFKGKHLRK
jgi:hypothetical protein